MHLGRSINAQDFVQHSNLSYSGLYHAVCMMNLVRATREGSNVTFFCEKCGRELDPEEVEEARRQKARLALHQTDTHSD